MIKPFADVDATIFRSELTKPLKMASHNSKYYAKRINSKASKSCKKISDIFKQINKTGQSKTVGAEAAVNETYANPDTITEPVMVIENPLIEETRDTQATRAGPEFQLNHNQLSKSIDYFKSLKDRVVQF